jgi:hypothetical protein
MNRFAPAFLLVLGLAQIAGDLLGLPALRGVAAATTASPLPKVFSAVRGLETYSTRFFIEYRDRAGVEHSLELTPEAYAPLRGPYNRRNAFGAVVAYGPLLSTDARTRPMFERVAAYALCGDAPLLRELGIDPAQLDTPARIRLVPMTEGELGDLPDVLEPVCSEATGP